MTAVKRKAAVPTSGPKRANAPERIFSPYQCQLCHVFTADLDEFVAHFQNRSHQEAKWMIQCSGDGCLYRTSNVNKLLDHLHRKRFHFDSPDRPACILSECFFATLTFEDSDHLSKNSSGDANGAAKIWSRIPRGSVVGLYRHSVTIMRDRKTHRISLSRSLDELGYLSIFQILALWIECRKIEQLRTLLKSEHFSEVKSMVLRWMDVKWRMTSWVYVVKLTCLSVWNGLVVPSQSKSDWGKRETSERFDIIDRNIRNYHQTSVGTCY